MSGHTVETRRGGAGEWRWLLTVVTLATLGRVGLSLLLGLSVDESYSTAVARQFSLSYFDHPPMHLWIVGVMARVAGGEAPWLVRLPFEWMGAASMGLLYAATRGSYGVAAARWAVLAFVLSPFFSVGAAGWVLPDGPLVFGALAMALAVRKALQTDRWSWWLLAGLAAGFALLSKYLLVLTLFGLVIYLLAVMPRRLLTAGPWLALATAAVCFSPVLIWNAQHHWASIAFQGARASFEGWHPSRALALLLASMLYVGLPSAWYGFGAIVRVVKATGPRFAQPEDVWWVCLGAPALCLFAVISTWAHVLPHWALIGWLFLLPTVGDRLSRSSLVARRIWLGLAAGLFVLIAGLAVAQGRFGVLDPYIKGFPLNDPLTEVVDWNELRPALVARGLVVPGRVVVVQSFVDAGKVDYALQGAMPVLCLCDDPHHYGIAQPPQRWLGAGAIVIANARRQDWLTRAQPYFRVVQPQDDIEIHRAGRVAVQLHVAVADGLRLP